jgi:plastocyanin
MMKKIFIIGAAVIAIGVGAWILTRNNYYTLDQSSGYPEAGTPQPPAAIPAGADAPRSNWQSAIKEFTITGQNYSFAPAAIAVKKGDTIKITFKNADGFHDLEIDEFNAETKRIKTGEEDVIIFVADKIGSFEFYCSVGIHRQIGMKGILTVTK